jgi:phospholipase A1/A2
MRLFILITGLFFGHITLSQSLFSKSDEIIYKTYSQRWELDSIDKQGTFKLVSYKPIYITAGRWSSRPNNQPRSENSNYSSTEIENFNPLEAKFQLSFKTKIAQGLFWGKADIWLGYTQKAHWQIYNTNISRAFRELNYEPEFILVYPLHFSFLGGQIRSLGVGFNHQSNGRDLPLSRSWNRIIFHLGYESDSWIVTFSPWIRLKDSDDENPEITNYIGRGELMASYSYKRHQFYTLITHPFTSLNKGSIQLNYVFPIKGHLRGHVQAFEGYGETMIDYNHRQTTLGIGVSFANW